MPTTIRNLGQNLVHDLHEISLIDERIDVDHPIAGSNEGVGDRPLEKGASKSFATVAEFGKCAFNNGEMLSEIVAYHLIPFPAPHPRSRQHRRPDTYVRQFSDRLIFAASPNLAGFAPRS
jgi:hypothetical protein